MSISDLQLDALMVALNTALWVSGAKTLEVILVLVFLPKHMYFIISNLPDDLLSLLLLDLCPNSIV